jgi:hypothetical protein
MCKTWSWCLCEVVVPAVQHGQKLNSWHVIILSDCIASIWLRRNHPQLETFRITLLRHTMPQEQCSVQEFPSCHICHLTVHPSVRIIHMRLVYSECLASATLCTACCFSLQNGVACCAVPSVWRSILSWNFWLRVTNSIPWSIILEKPVVTQWRSSLNW